MYSIFIISVCLILIVIFFNNNDIWLKWRYRKEEWTDCKDVIRKHKNNDKIVLFLHEFSGCPESLKEMADKIYAQGWDIIIPALPGATENLLSLKNKPPSLYSQWVKKAEDEYLRLTTSYKHIAVIGASLGGSIALELASYPASQIEALVTLSAPIRLSGDHFRRKFLRNTMLVWSGILCLFKKTTKTGLLKQEARLLQPLHGVEGLLVLPAVHSHKVGLGRLRRKLKKIKVPLLVIHAKDDRTVSVKNQDFICKQVISNIVIKKRIVIQKDMTRHHMIWSHKNMKEFVFYDIIYFLSECVRGKE